MRNTNSYLYILLEEIRPDVELFKSFLIAFNFSKLNGILDALLDSNGDESKFHYNDPKKPSIKTYKSLLRRMLEDFLIVRNSKLSKERKIRRTLDVVELQSTIDKDLLKKSKFLLKTTLNSINIHEDPELDFLLYRELARVEDKVNALNWDDYYKIWDKAVTSSSILYNRSYTRSFMYQIDPLFKEREFVANETELTKISELKLEIDQFDINIKQDELSTIYYRHAKSLVEATLGNYNDAYIIAYEKFEQLKNVEAKDNNSLYIDFIDEGLKLMIFAMQSAVYSKIIKIAKEVREKAEMLIESDSTYKNYAIAFSDLLVSISLERADISDKIKLLQKIQYNDQPARYKISAFMFLIKGFSMLKDFNAALRIVRLLMPILQESKERKHLEEIVRLYLCVLLFECDKNNISPLKRDFISILDSFDKRRKRKERKNLIEYNFDIRIVEMLRKMPKKTSGPARFTLFHALQEALKLEMNFISQIAWANFNFYFDIDKWIDDNIEFYSPQLPR